MTEEIKQAKASVASFWGLIWGLGIAGQIGWNVENQWLNTYVYAKIVKDPIIISWAAAIAALVMCFSTFLFGTLSDRKGSRRLYVAGGYTAWGLLTVTMGFVQFIAGPGKSATMILLAGLVVVVVDGICSFFGSIGNDAGFNAWANDNMTGKNRGQIGAALATQPVIGTVLVTVVGGILIGKNANYILLYSVMGGAVALTGIISAFFMKESPTLKPHVEGGYWSQFSNVFHFKKFFQMKELVWVNVALAVFFIAFDVYFVHLGNFMIYYLGFSAGTMGIIEGSGLLLATLLAIPTGKLINKNKSPYICMAAILSDLIGLLVVAFFVTPKTVNTATVFNWVLLISVFLLGAGYIVIFQTLVVWSKQLYPKESKGQFEGVRVIFFNLIPFVVSPFISNPIIRANGSFVNSKGITEYLPTGMLFIVAAGIVVFTFVPIFFAKHYHDKRIQEAK